MKLPLDASFTMFNQIEFHYLQYSYSSVESKDHDPHIFPEGISLDIRKDEVDEDHIKRFVSPGDDEGEKELEGEKIVI